MLAGFVGFFVMVVTWVNYVNFYQVQNQTEHAKMEKVLTKVDKNTTAMALVFIQNGILDKNDVQLTDAKQNYETKSN